MTFREFMLENGYELQTTFWNDFSIADRFGLSAIQDTFNRAFEEWKENYKYLTELVLVLNHKIWQYYETRPEIATLYNTLWAQASQYAMEYLKDDELSYSPVLLFPALAFSIPFLYTSIYRFSAAVQPAVD